MGFDIIMIVSILSISIGALSVIGLYFLVKELFNAKLAWIASFLFAVSSWHIFVLRSGAKEVFISFALIYTFYFIWHGFKYGHTFDFFIAGLFGGSGFYVGRSYFIALLSVLCLFLNYWDYIKKDFALSKYEQAKVKVLGGFSLFIITTLVAALPVGYFVWQNPSLALSAGNSIFSSDSGPLVGLWSNFVEIIDRIVLIKFDSNSLNFVSWPISIFFVIGFIKEFIHWLKKKHGHLSIVHTLIFSWLFVMMVPALLSANGPSVLNSIGILPVVMIISANGLWWVIDKLNDWDHITYPRLHKHWTGLNAGPFLALLALLLSLAILEISKVT